MIRHQDTAFTEQGVSIELLADNPHLISSVGEIRWKEWGHPPEPEELGWWVDITRKESGRDTLPVSWVAIDHLGQAVGAVGLAHFDIPERHNCSPWLVGMIVATLRRNSAIGGQLVASLEGWAKNRGYSQVWVATGGRAVAFYQKYGWAFEESIHRPSGEVVEILTKLLS